jgi:DNA ligase D-like protein (predicted 3'-phosphoesterase)
MCAMSAAAARRISLTGAVSDIVLREDVRVRARGLGVLGWVRLMEDGTLCVHAEGDPSALEELVAWLRSLSSVDVLADRSVRVEGHEQFAIRGVPAGAFVVVVEERRGSAPSFELRLEVGDAMRSWVLPKGPSMDPAVKRFAVQAGDRAVADNDAAAGTGSEGAVVWDRGTYEQGGRVPWPDALDRGHAVFVLHGGKLRGGFALQRTRDGDKPQWLLVKRRDDDARSGSDVIAGLPGH